MRSNKGRGTGALTKHIVIELLPLENDRASAQGKLDRLFRSVAEAANVIADFG
jgi:hypothetical protein